MSESIHPKQPQHDAPHTRSGYRRNRQRELVPIVKGAPTPITVVSTGGQRSGSSGLGNRVRLIPIVYADRMKQRSGASASAVREPAAVSAASAEIRKLIAEAAQNLADYQRLTAEGKLGEAGQKLEQLKRTLDELSNRR
jgi:hypothetical protein